MEQLSVPGEPPVESEVTHLSVLAMVERLGLGEPKSTRITVYPVGKDPITAEIDANKLGIVMGSLDPVLRVDAKITIQGLAKDQRRTIIEVLKIHQNNGTNGNTAH